MQKNLNEVSAESGFGIKTSRLKPKGNFGEVLICPKCGRTILEAEVSSLLIRCPKCRFWLLVMKTFDK